MEHVKQLRRDKATLLEQKDLVEEEEKATLMLLQKRLENQNEEVKELSFDGIRQAGHVCAAETTATSPGCRTVERKLDAVLERLSQLEGQLNARDKTGARVQKSSSACPQPDSRFRAVVPLLGPVSLALDFGCPLCREAKQTEQAYSFWIGLFK